jgi:hypothetical protein
MNSAQRRKVYRAMPKVGARVTWTSKSGRVRVGIVECHMEYRGESFGQFNYERLNVPCVQRLRVQLDSGAWVHPLVRLLRPATGAA